MSRYFFQKSLQFHVGLKNPCYHSEENRPFYWFVSPDGYRINNLYSPECQITKDSFSHLIDLFGCKLSAQQIRVLFNTLDITGNGYFDSSNQKILKLGRIGNRL